MEYMTKTILIVDDEPTNIDVLKGILPNHYKVKAALKGEVAIKLCQKQIPDLIFMDLLMPGLSGLEVIEQLRTEPNTEKVPIIIVSGNSVEHTANEQEQLHVLAHLQKPINQQALNNVLINQLAWNLADE